MKASRAAVGRDAPTRLGDSVQAYETARESLERCGFGRGREMFGFNQGSFSLIDLVDGVLDYTGPAHITIATWVAAKSEIGEVAEWIERDRVASARWIIDHFFVKRQPLICQMMRDIYGDAAVRVMRTHAKFVLFDAGDWQCVLQSSMNLNKNPRMENYLLTTDTAFYSAYAEVVESLFGLQEVGEGFTGWEAVSRAMGALGDGKKTKKRRQTVRSPWRELPNR